jgi:hypothetical protein
MCFGGCCTLAAVHGGASAHRPGSELNVACTIIQCMYPPPWGIRFGIGGRGMEAVHHRATVHVQNRWAEMCTAGQTVRSSVIGARVSQSVVAAWRSVLLGGEDGTLRYQFLVWLLVALAYWWIQRHVRFGSNFDLESSSSRAPCSFHCRCSAMRSEHSPPAIRWRWHHGCCRSRSISVRSSLARRCIWISAFIILVYV